MSACTLTGELIDADLAARHDALMAQFANGVVQMCIALARIRSESTYRAQGYESFPAFAKGELSMAANTAKTYASVGPALEQLRTHGVNVRHPDMLRPIASMLNTKQEPRTQRFVIGKQVAIVRTAALEAKKTLVPLDADLIATVAQRDFGWLPPSEYRKSKRGEGPPKSEADRRAEMKQHIEAAFAVILSYQLTGMELVKALGPTDEWLGFDYAMDVLTEARGAKRC